MLLTAFSGPSKYWGSITCSNSSNPTTKSPAHYWTNVDRTTLLYSWLQNSPSKQFCWLQNMTQLAWDTYMDTQAADTAQRDTGALQDTGLLHRCRRYSRSVYVKIQAGSIYNGCVGSLYLSQCPVIPAGAGKPGWLIGNRMKVICRVICVCGVVCVWVLRLHSDLYASDFPKSTSKDLLFTKVVRKHGSRCFTSMYLFFRCNVFKRIILSCSILQKCPNSYYKCILDLVFNLFWPKLF